MLLDAGAGDKWHYDEQETGLRLGRSEGLAIASLQMFCQGNFASEGLPQADALRLQELTEAELATGFHCGCKN